MHLAASADCQVITISSNYPVSLFSKPLHDSLYFSMHYRDILKCNAFIHAQFAALIAFLVISWLNWRQTRMQSLVRLFMMTRSGHSDGWQDRKDCFTDIQPNSISLFYRSSFGWCTFFALIWLAPGAEAKLQHASEKSRWMWMQKNTPVPHLNKGISYQEKGDKNCSFEQGGQA